MDTGIDMIRQKLLLDMDGGRGESEKFGCVTIKLILITPPPRVISFQFPPVPPLNPAGPDWSPLGSHWKRCDSPSKKKEKSSSPLNPGGK